MPRKRESDPDFEWSLELLDVTEALDPDGSRRIELHTDDRVIACRYRAPEDGDRAVLWVFGAGGGWGGPAGGLYPRLGRQLAADGFASLEVAYRYPGYLQPCVMDVLMGAAWLDAQERKRVVLVGHSFGGAVVLNAAALSDNVRAVAAMSPQLYGADVTRLGGRSVLFIHGEDDEVLPAELSRQLHARAGEPKKLLIYPGCRHGLDDCRDALDRDLLAWIRGVL